MWMMQRSLGNIARYVDMLRLGMICCPIKSFDGCKNKYFRMSKDFFNPSIVGIYLKVGNSSTSLSTLP
jgi:hypothetical protein